jgi:hypothetical protein
MLSSNRQGANHSLKQSRLHKSTHLLSLALAGEGDNSPPACNKLAIAGAGAVIFNLCAKQTLSTKNWHQGQFEWV